VALALLYAMGVMGAARDVQATPMHSPVYWALLGLVIERPSYAYELAQRFERTYDGVVALSSVSHVYTALATLRSRSLIEEVPGTRAGRQPKTRYRATAAGIDGYREWLIGQVGEDRRRQELLVLQLTSLTRNPELALAVMDGYEQACLAQATSPPLARERLEGVDARSRLRERLMAEENRLAAGAKLAWIEYARRELKALIDERAPRA
jgi:DNA-binding PadR family transcriptional regulator